MFAFHSPFYFFPFLFQFIFRNSVIIIYNVISFPYICKFFACRYSKREKHRQKPLEFIADITFNIFLFVCTLIGLI